MGIRIAMCGLAGTGKSTVRTLLAGKLGIVDRSVGDIFRQIAQQRNISPQELEGLAEADLTVDRELDERTRIFGRTYESYIIEGRRVAIVLPEAISVLLTCHDSCRFGRIFNRDNGNERLYQCLEDARRVTLIREEVTSRRYTRLYGETLASLFNPKRFQLVIDTTLYQPDEVAHRICSFVRG